MKNTLLLGATGFVGQNVKKVISKTQPNLTLSSQSLGTDLLYINQIIELIKETKPELVRLSLLRN